MRIQGREDQARQRDRCAGRRNGTRRGRARSRGLRRGRALPGQGSALRRASALAIGDSIMLGAVSQLSRRGSRWMCAAAGSSREGLSVLASRRPIPAHGGGDELGTNWTVERRQVRRALITIGRERVLGLVTPREVGGVASSDQAVMRTAGERWPRRVKVLDWVRYAAGTRTGSGATGSPATTRGARSHATDGPGARLGGARLRRPAARRQRRIRSRRSIRMITEAASEAPAVFRCTRSLWRTRTGRSPMRIESR